MQQQCALLKQSDLGRDSLPAERAGAELITTGVAGLVATVESQPPWCFHTHCTAHGLCIGLPLILCYIALEHHLPYSLGAGL